MLFPYLMKVSFLLAVLTLSYRWLIQFETFSKTNRLLLIFNILAAWTLPLIPLTNWGPTEVQKEFHHAVPKIIGNVPLSAAKLTSASLAETTNSYENTLNWQLTDWLTLIYFTGVALMLSTFLFQVIKIFLSLWKLPSQKLENGITLIEDSTANSPYSFFRWIVCNPARHADRELQHILAHESEHVRQLHSLDLMFAEMQRILLWFNPFAWFHRKLVQGNLEYLADRAVLQNGVEKKLYQFNLLKVVLQTNELPLTNSFAQSLLKKRIKMMNRKPSNWWALGKYAFLIVMLYLSTAFVAPYKEKIIALTPKNVKPVLKALVEESDIAIPVSMSDIRETVSSIKDTVILKSPTKTKNSENLEVQKVKGILIKNDTLYWAITALTSWDDISQIKKSINVFGAEMQINTLKYDPLQSFITSIAVHVKSSGSSGTGYTNEEQFAPTRGYSGYITKRGNGMGQLPPEALNAELKSDYEKALLLMKANEIKYFELKLVQGMKSSSSVMFTGKYIEGKNTPQQIEKSGIGKSEKNTLIVTDMFKDADLYLNTKTTNLEELNLLPFDQFEKVSIIKDDKDKKHLIFYTK